MPNPNTIPWLHYQDIQVPDVSIREQFQSLCLQGNFESALNLLETNEQQLQGKAYIADTINTICNGILDLESRFDDGILIYLSELAQKWQLLIDSLRKRGNWIASSTYVKNNFVVYNQEVYMALTDVPTGILPTNTTYWLHLSLRGLEGAHGLNVNLKYNWNTDTTYSVNDLVAYKNNIYVAIKNNKGVAPDTDINSWILFVVAEVGKINVGINPPDNPVANTVWFHTKVDPLSYTGNEPIVGQFRYYKMESENLLSPVYYWEDMCPNTFYTLVQNNEYLRKKRILVNITITPQDWNGLTWTYENNNIKDDSIVHIMPMMPSSSPAYKLYNQLSMQTETGRFTLSVKENVDQDLPIQIVIK